MAMKIRLKFMSLDDDIDDEDKTPQHERIVAKTPKLPVFNDTGDDLYAYLQRFERYATCQHWRWESWAINLSALLSGKALDVYSRLSSSDAKRLRQTEGSTTEEISDDRGRFPERNLVPLVQKPVRPLHSLLYGWRTTSVDGQTSPNLKDLLTA